jgi:hypothetical protein
MSKKAKQRKLFAVMLAAVLGGPLGVLSLGCGTSESAPPATPTSPQVYAVEVQASTSSALPTCATALAGTTAYVASPPALWRCNDNAWAQIACTDAKGGDFAYASASQTLWACVGAVWTQVALPEAGPTGPQGIPGTPGSQVELSPVPPGANCAAGGVLIEVGLAGDAGFDVQQSAYVCNGLPGSGDGGPGDAGAADGGSEAGSFGDASVVFSANDTLIGTQFVLDDNNVYWSSTRPGPDGGSIGVISQCAKTGCTTPTILVSTNLQLSPQGAIAVDSANVYYTGTIDGAVYRCAIGGCGGTPTLVGVPPSTDAGLQAAGVVVANGNLYWDESGPGNTPNGMVYACATASCPSSTTVIATLSAQSIPGWLRADTSNVYWTNSNTTTFLDAVQECALGGCGGSPTTIATMPVLEDLSVFANNVYFTAGSIQEPDGGVSNPMGIYTCPAAGCGDASPTSLVTNYVTVVVADSSGLYWYAPDYTSVYWCPLSGCGKKGRSAVTVTSGVSNGGIQTDSEFAYVVNNDYASTGVGQILRIRKQ